MSLARHRRDWERLAAEDPLWAVLTDPSRRHGGWTEAEFLATGESEIAAVLDRCRALGLPGRRGRALDFGCGAGRLVRALSTRFDEVVGVDIAESMLAAARRLNADRPNVSFVWNAEPDLRRFEDGSFDLVYSSLVLQHMPTLAAAEGYVREFVRLLAPDGAAVFQAPVRMPALRRLQLARRAYAVARAVGVPEPVLLRRTSLTPMRMLAVPESRVREVVEAAGGTVVAADALGRHSVRYVVRRR